MTADQDPHTGSTQAAWEAHEREQLKYFRSLSLRTKLEAVEGMADMVRHFQEMRAAGRFKEASESRKHKS